MAGEAVAPDIVSSSQQTKFDEIQYRQLRKRFLESRVDLNEELPSGQRLRKKNYSALIDRDLPGFRTLKVKINQLERFDNHEEIYRLLLQLKDWQIHNRLAPCLRTNANEREVSETIDLSNISEPEIIDIDTYILDVLLVKIVKADPDGAAAEVVESGRSDAVKTEDTCTGISRPLTGAEEHQGTNKMNSEDAMEVDEDLPTRLEDSDGEIHYPELALVGVEGRDSHYKHSVDEDGAEDSGESSAYGSEQQDIQCIEALVVQNHLRHDIETIRKMLDQLKRNDENPHRDDNEESMLLRGMAKKGEHDNKMDVTPFRQLPFWIGGFGGDPKTYFLPRPQSMGDTRNLLLLNSVGWTKPIPVYIVSDEKDSDDMFHCGDYRITSSLHSKDKRDDLIDLVNKLNLDEEDHPKLLFREAVHFKFYLEPVPLGLRVHKNALASVDDYKPVRLTV